MYLRKMIHSLLSVYQSPSYIKYILVYKIPGATHMDGFPDHLRDVVDDHWGTFPPQHPLVVDLFGIFFFVLTLASVFGNGLVIYVFLTTKSLRTPTNMYIINLALADVGIMLTQGPLMFINAFTSDFWMWGSLICKLYGCTGGIFGKIFAIDLKFNTYSCN